MNAEDLFPTAVLGDLEAAHTAVGPQRGARLVQARQNAIGAARFQNPQAHQFVMQAIDSLNRREVAGEPMPTLEQIMANVDANVQSGKFTSLKPKDYNDIYRAMFVLLRPQQ
jgi:hypothetical protein